MIKRLRCLSLLSAFYCILLGGTPERVVASTDPASAVVKFAILHGDDVVADLRTLAGVAQTPVNVEIVRDHDEPAKLYVPTLSLAPNSYTLAQILNKLTETVRGFSWRNDGQSINIILSLSDNVDDPFNHRVASAFSADTAPSQWISRLETCDPGGGFAFEKPFPTMISGLQAGAEGNVHLSVPSGVTLRWVMNRVSEDAGLHWLAYISDSNSAGTVDLTTKRPVQSINSGNALVGRTAVWFENSGDVSLTVIK